MKKIFTLIAAALVAVSANAKEEIPISSFSPWGATVTLDGSTITMDGSYQGGAIYIGRDMTEFDYVWIKFSNATGNPNFGITYDEWLKNESWGSVFASTTSTLTGSGLVGIKLDKETVMTHGNAETDGVGIGDKYAQHVQQITIQSGSSSASVTVEGIWFGTVEEFVADGGDVPLRPEPGGSLTMWEGNHEYPDGWSATDVIDAKFFDVAKVGDIIYCTISDDASANLIFKHVSSWADFAELESGKEKGTGYVKTTIPSDEVISELKKNGLRIQGIFFTLLKVELQVPSSTEISSVKNEVDSSNAPIYNLAGQRVDKSFKGVVIQNGKKFIQK
jgi:hypothetical protein